MLVRRRSAGSRPLELGPILHAGNARATKFYVAVAGLVLVLLVVTLHHPIHHLGAMRTRVRSWVRQRDLASLDPIDVHTHIFQTGPEFMAMLDRFHMNTLDILHVDDSNPYLTTAKGQGQDAQKFMLSRPGHSQLCTTFDPSGLNEANYSEKTIAFLNDEFARGAVAVKVWKNVGMELRNPAGKYVMVDDPRFNAIYDDIAAHHKTLIVHAADPDDAWGFVGFHINYFRANPQWDMTRKPGAPPKRDILEARDHLLAMHPNLSVVGAHLGSMEYDLDGLAARLQKYPNFAVDTAAREMDLMLQPRDKVRVFILQYQDRILYGTDGSWYAGTSDAAEARLWQERYVRDWRFFATDDTFEFLGRQIQGLNLPHSVLRKIYHDNAVHWIPGIAPGAQ